MNKILLLLLLNLAYLIPINGYCSISNKIEDSLTIKIDALLKEYNKPDKPGLTIGIIDNGKFVFTKGYGLANIEKQIPNHPDIAYNVASVSKQFTAALVLKLIQEQKLSFDDDIRKYIPEFSDYGSKITISNLLYHTSGIRDYMVLMWLSGLSFEAPFSNKDALALIIRQKELNFIPNKRCVYSNSNYILLAEIIKRVTGLEFEAYAEKNLFKPLQLNKTGFGKSKKTNIALSYSKSENGYIPYWNNNQTVGDGGIFTSLVDLLKWDNLFYDTSSLNYKLLKSGTLDNGNQLSYGMGIIKGQYRNAAIQMHPGAFLGYRAEVLRFPEKNISIICFGNMDEINPETITRQIADIYVFRDIGNQVGELFTEYDLKSIGNLLGKYEVAPNVFIDIKYDGSLLTGQATGQPKQVLYPIEKSAYRIGVTGDEVIFNEDGGIIKQLTIRQKHVNTIAQKLELISVNKGEYTGDYYNQVLQTTYSFFIKNDTLYFKCGENLIEECIIYKKYDKMQFGYKNLENATIDFIRNDLGKVVGFMLSSGRIAGIKFIKY